MKRSLSPENPPTKRHVAEIVPLNVGGKIFDTSPTTLLRSQYFHAYLEGRLPHGEDGDGRLFIDRDGSMFAILLNFMRTTKLYLPQQVIEERRHELLAEAEYFGMDWMAHRINGEISHFDMRPEDRKIRDEELLEICPLLDVFESDLSLKDPAELQCTCLPCGVERPSLSTSYMDFHKNFDDLIGGWLAAVSDIEGLCFAGGSVIGTLLGCPVGDVDIFLIGDPEEGKSILKKVLKAIQGSHSKRYGDQAKLVVTRSKHAVTVFQAIADRPGGKPVQVVTSCYESVAKLLASFDLDCCCFAFTPKQNKVSCTARGRRAVVYSANLVESRFDGPGYTRRLEKYDARGFRICVPGFEERVVPRSVRETPYLYLQKFDLLLQLGARDHGAQEAIQIKKFNGRSFEYAEMKITPTCVQSGVALKGVHRLAASKYGRVDTLICEMCTGKKQGRTLACLPLKVANGRYNLIWLPHGTDDAESDVEGYTGCQTECVERLLEAHVDMRMSTADSPDFEWWNGGAMQRMSKEPLRKCEETAHATVVANLSCKSHLLFVYDVINCVGKFSQLKFVLDAGRYPLSDLDEHEFEQTYGLSKRLSFKRAEPRGSMKQDWWSAFYK